VRDGSLTNATAGARAPHKTELAEESLSDWQELRLQLAFVFGMICPLVFHLVFKLDNPRPKLWLGICCAALIGLRLSWAMDLGETRNGWKFYEWLCWTSFIWIEGMSFWFAGKF
jgi:hypothetical protein